jgi:hypothetical protein
MLPSVPKLEQLIFVDGLFQITLNPIMNEIFFVYRKGSLRAHGESLVGAKAQASI